MVIGGHFGVRGTYSKLVAYFYWPKILHDIKEFIKACLVYQGAKFSTQPQQRTLQPLSISRCIWEDIIMDFIINLPSSNCKTVIWVVVHRLSKYAHFMGLLTHFTVAPFIAARNAKINVSDRDRVFLNHFWRELFKLCETTLKFSSAYHPQTDGQMEVLNRVHRDIHFLLCQ
ncbi:hypothetical protein Sango_0362100 [Sesamum angolense]|uniref:Integrase zinc-binding domain-containing protein n=1 Tax=Sesamum angolense TaxID=2727404 RepID=A0AAE2C3L6_9LAMI|nr:hypothetical protein Sango_0362100 [Sesamum angolense]